MKRFDFHNPRIERIEGAPEGVDALEDYMTEALGARHLAGSLYEIGPGRKGFPYHWEAAKEEWLIVLEGTPTVRTPDGERELRAGDLVCFPTGPEGAHQILNRSEERVRFIWLSNATEPNVVFYPDSRKIGVRTGELRFNFVEDDAVPYWTGES
jgi:uncharacterized cupin superfamily protein